MAGPTRATTLGRYTLPTKAVNALAENGIDETNIEAFSLNDLKAIDGFGATAEKSFRFQRAKYKASKRRAAATRNGNKGVMPAQNMRLTEETSSGYSGPTRDPNYRSNHDDFLDMPSGDPEGREPTITVKCVDNRMILDIGPEHGMMPRHMRWAENVVRNSDPSMLVGSIERLTVGFFRKAMANDSSKGGTIGLPQGGDTGINHDFGVTLSLE